MIHAFVAGFARALMFLVVAVVFGTIALLAMPGRGGNYLVNWVILVWSVVLAWFVSGVPFYVRAAKHQAMVRRRQ